jgi:murein tripeptide amidase MpaA
VTCLFHSSILSGESNASWVLHGFLEFICGDSAEARALRQRVVFKVVPMLEPDGVIVGNYRSSVAGVDLNRFWHKVNRNKYPTIAHTKRLVKALHKSRNVILYLDLHGHSIMHNFG